MYFSDSAFSGACIETNLFLVSRDDLFTWI